MKVAINNSSLKSNHSFRGIGTYTKNLIDFLKKSEEVEILEFADMKAVKDVDLVHYPYFDLFKNTLPLMKKFPTVVTIHDVIPLSFPEAFPPGIKGSINNFLQRHAIKKVDCVITDSNFSKIQITKYLNIDPDRIFVVYLAPAQSFQVIKNQSFLDSVKQKYSLPDKFVLFTGSVNYNKNLINIAKGIKLAGIDGVFVGKGFEDKNPSNHIELQAYRSFLKQIEGDSRFRLLGFIDNNDLIAIYNLAEVLLLPSLAEGFGLPILEAQACGTPVITSNISAMPEIAGKGALFINPESFEEIKNAILQITNNKKISDGLISKGFENVNKFSWERCADETIDVYRQVLQIK